MNQSPYLTKEQTVASAMPDDEIDLGQLVKVVWGGKWLIAAIVIAFAGLAFVYVQSVAPVFRTDALVQVESKSGALSLSSEMGDFFEQDSDVSTELEIIKSRMMLSKVVAENRLQIIAAPDRLPIVGSNFAAFGLDTKPLADLSGSSYFSELASADAAISLTSDVVPSSIVGQIVKLTKLADSTFEVLREDGAELVGQIGSPVALFDGYSLTVTSLEGQPGDTFTISYLPMRKAVDSLRAALSVSERGKGSGIIELGLKHTDPALAVATLNSLIRAYLQQNVDRSAAEVEKSLTYLDSQLPTIQDQLLGAEQALNDYRAQNASVDLTLETTSLLKQIVEIDGQLGQLALQEVEISQRFTPKHPTYIALLEQRDSLEQQKKMLEQQAGGLPKTQQEVLSLSRDVQVNQETYIQLLNKTQELKILKAGTVGNVRIIDSAETSPSPIAPRKPLIVALAVVLGGMLGVGLVMVRAFLKRGIKSTAEIEAQGVSVYAVIPSSPEQAVIDADNEKRHAGRILSIEAHENVAVEALKSLRTSLQFGLLDAEQNVIAISGPAPGVGKSFISANLAVVLAQAGKKVLLVEADLRRGKLNQKFAIPKKRVGLSELLTGTHFLSEVMVNTQIETLKFIPRGKAPPNPSELLLRSEFKQLLDDASTMFDYVIVDTPPVLAVTDASIIGRFAGMVLMVAKHGVTELKELEAANAAMDKGGVMVSGVVLNGYDTRLAASSYGAYGAYGSYSYDYKSKV